ncbi:MAG: hypothetical protein KF841_07860 [Phycisphaerae bacterium]|nr:hypothetical protein [Phycisphaerae bacterium]
MLLYKQFSEIGTHMMMVRSWKLLTLALFCAVSTGCSSPIRTPPPAVVLSNAERILAGFDPLTPDAPFSRDTECLFKFEILRDGTAETSFLTIRLVEDNLDGIETIRVNPSSAAAVKAGELAIMDTDQPSYVLKVREWTLAMDLRKRGRPTRADGSTERPRPSAEVDSTSNQDATATGTENDDSENPPAEPYIFRSKPILTYVALHDVHGKLLKARFLLLPEKCMREGFYKPDLCGMDSVGFESTEALASSKVFPVVLDTYAAMQSLTYVILATPVLWPLVHEFIPLSVKLAAVFGGLKLNMLIENVRLSSTPLDGLPADYSNDACGMTFVLQANGKPIIQTRVTGAKPISPLDSCAGVLLVEGESLTDATRKFRITLLSARRGNPASQRSPNFAMRANPVRTNPAASGSIDTRVGVRE